MVFLQVNVVTPGGMVYQHRAKQVHAITTDGGITILPNHTPIIVPLAIDNLTVTRDTEEKKCNHLAVSGGILEVRDNIVNIIANTAERARDIDINRAERAKEAAQKFLSEAEQQKNKQDFQRAKLALAKAINRIGVSDKSI
ncbi:F0F1 ATP synthase subunit epsilon [Jeotgalibaca sp. MA1X17-3]|uniref:F0F1 ATP synthase subunit epsilon n=1 Tax=Jeotgalibaca sp. MA1X17-3 TaxID=2908211 RepID=UPI001F216831|nr:F0F1 ATP synthase subunit epsilon [Jeotgalibaca sp. MA1X17-3]UJF16552.1 F0F1 ATP synthase subunit epsilon [Jeotgalibaca sp. MA1X17-3]